MLTNNSVNDNNAYRIKKMKQFNISEDAMDRMLHLARQAQNLDLIEKLKVKQGFYSKDNRDWY